MGMTFREVDAYTRGFNKREKEEWRQKISIAHLTASLMRVKAEAFPKLRDLLVEEGIAETPQEKDARIWDTLKKFAKPGELSIYKPSRGRKKVKKEDRQ